MIEAIQLILLCISKKGGLALQIASYSKSVTRMSLINAIFRSELQEGVGVTRCYHVPAAVRNAR